MTFKSLIICSTLFLASCSSHAPNLIVLNPEVSEVTQNQSDNIPLSIKTIDTRKANYVVRFNNKDDAARLVSPFQSPRQQLAVIFQDGFSQAGYQLSANSDRQLQIQLEQLLTNVNESFLGYQADTNIIINVIATKGNQTLTKRFDAKGKLKGSMSADFASLEQEINQLITKLSTDIINDNELNDFLNSQP